MKIIIGIIIIILVGFFVISVFPPLGQGCHTVYIEGQEPCSFHKETGYEYFFQRSGTLQDLLN